MTTTHMLETAEVDIAYDLHGPLPPADGRPPLFMVGQPMDASGFGTLASYFPDRTVVTYDPRGLGRSERTDGRTDHVPEEQAEDLHGIIEALGAGPVDMFASSGGAVTALALVAAHPTDVRTLVAHEPPLLTMLPDAEQAFAAEREVQSAYQKEGFGAGMAGFIALTSWQGEFTDDFAVPDPAQFGLPGEDDGSRDDPLLSGSSNAVTAYRPDLDALSAVPTRVVIAAGTESRGTLTWRTAVATAEALGREPTVFPSHHGGFLGGEHGYAGEPEAFAATLRQVLDDGRWAPGSDTGPADRSDGRAEVGVLAHPRVHRDSRRHPGVDRPGGAELGDGDGECRPGPRLRREAGTLLAEQQHALGREVRRLQRHGPRTVVDRHDGESMAAGEGQQVADAGMVPQALVAVGDHRAAAVPPAAPDDVHLRGEEGVGGAHHRADVEVVAEVLDRYVEGVPAAVEVRDDRFDGPVAVTVDDVAPVTVGQELGVVPGVVRPGPRPRADADRRAPIGGAREFVVRHAGRIAECLPTASSTRSTPRSGAPPWPRERSGRRPWSRPASCTCRRRTRCTCPPAFCTRAGGTWCCSSSIPRG